MLGEWGNCLCMSSITTSCLHPLSCPTRSNCHPSPPGEVEEEEVATTEQWGKVAPLRRCSSSPLASLWARCRLSRRRRKGSPATSHFPRPTFSCLGWREEEGGTT